MPWTKLKRQTEKARLQSVTKDKGLFLNTYKWIKSTVKVSTRNEQGIQIRRHKIDCNDSLWKNDINLPTSLLLRKRQVTLPRCLLFARLSHSHGLCWSGHGITGTFIHHQREHKMSITPLEGSLGKCSKTSCVCILPHSNQDLETSFGRCPHMFTKLNGQGWPLQHCLL